MNCSSFTPRHLFRNQKRHRHRKHPCLWISNAFSNCSRFPFHFFVDFYHYPRFGESLTGARYIPLRYGPCPDQYRALYDCLERMHAITQKKSHGFTATKKPDMRLFDDREMETLEFVIKVYEKKGGKFLYDLSHKEKGFRETQECDFISYEHAKSLNLKGTLLK